MSLTAKITHARTHEQTCNWLCVSRCIYIFRPRHLRPGGAGGVGCGGVHGCGGNNGCGAGNDFDAGGGDFSRGGSRSLISISMTSDND